MVYYGLKFDSSYELGFIHYCISNDIPIQRCDIAIPYTYNNENHNYFPDFVIGNSIVEIKGFETKQTIAKSQAGIKYCDEHNLKYKFLMFKDLKKLGCFIPTNALQLNFFDKEYLTVTSYPTTWKQIIESSATSIGFAFVITKLLTGEKICNYIVTKDFSEKMINSLFNQKNEKIDILGYADFEFDLYKLKNNFDCFTKKTYKRNLKREQELFSIKMSQLTRGDKNPNYGNKWTDEQKQALSEKRIKNGMSCGKLNGMYGKKGENSIAGYHINVYDKNMNFIKTYLSIVALGNEFSLNKHEIKFAVENHLLVNDCYFEWTEDTLEKIKNWRNSALGVLNDMFNKKGENAVNGVPVKVFDKDNKLIYEFKTNGETCEKLNITSYRLDKCIRTGESYNGMFFKKGRRNYTEKSFPAKNAIIYYKFDKNGNIIKTFHTQNELFGELKKLNISITRALNHEEINGYFYSQESVFNPNWLKHKSRQLYKISMYKDNELIKEFDSIKEVAKLFKIDTRILKRLIAKKLPINGYVLKYSEHAENIKQSIREQHKKLNYVFKYKVDLLDENKHILQTFNKLNDVINFLGAENYKKIKKCFKNGERFLNYYIVPNKNCIENFKKLSEKRSKTISLVESRNYKHDVYHYILYNDNEQFEFDYMRDVENFLNMSSYLIRKSLKETGKVKNFCFKKVSNMRNTQSQIIYQIDSKTLQIIKKFDNFLHLAQSLNMSKSQFQKIIDNKIEIDGCVFIKKEDFNKINKGKE